MGSVPPVDYLWNGPSDATLRIALAHGAGNGMESEFMDTIARGLGEKGFQVVRFEFRYMSRRRITGKKAGPDRAPVLQERWKEVIRQFDDRPLIIGGKSMGGRIASMVADEMSVAGLVCLGFPFHPPGKPEKLRTEHLAKLQTPCLICQGERDTFGKPEEVSSYVLSDAINLVWIEDGDHSFKPRKRSGRNETQNIELVIEAISNFASANCRPEI